MATGLRNVSSNGNGEQHTIIRSVMEDVVFKYAMMAVATAKKASNIDFNFILSFKRQVRFAACPTACGKSDFRKESQFEFVMFRVRRITCS